MALGGACGPLPAFSRTHWLPIIEQGSYDTSSRRFPGGEGVEKVYGPRQVIPEQLPNTNLTFLISLPFPSLLLRTAALSSATKQKQKI